MAPDIAGLAAGVAVCLDAPADSVRTLAARTASAPAAIAALTISVRRRAFMPLFVHPAHLSGSNYEPIAAWRREPALRERAFVRRPVVSRRPHLGQKLGKGLSRVLAGEEARGAVSGASRSN